MLQSKSRLRMQLLLLFALLNPLYIAADTHYSGSKALVFGFLPSRSPVTLFRQFAPLREYLSQRLQHPVILETAPDYAKFLHNTQKRKYDFVLTAPHFALLAIDSGEYTAPVTYTKALMADILVPQNSPITRINQLSGKLIALPPPGAIISMAGKHYLSQHGLDGARRPHYLSKNSHNACIQALLAGEVAAAVTSVNITRQFLARGARIRKLAHTTALPGMAFLVARDLPAGLQRAFVRALTRMQDIPEGEAALHKMHYPGYRKARPHEFETARPYLKMYRADSRTYRH